MPNMIAVESSNIKEIGWENGTLWVRFKNGGTYTYAKVPKSVHDALMRAESKGKYFIAHVKNVYEYAKIG